MRLMLPMPGNEAMAAAIAACLPGELGKLETRRFPDGEIYMRIPGDVQGRDVYIVCTLADPDPQFLGLAFAAATARELGVRSINLVTPYLAYMRQDIRFRPGEAVSSRHFAQLLSGLFDRVITIDPHLHRIADLAEIFTRPTRVLQAAPLLGEWVKAHVSNPLLIGPDSESEQWVTAVGAHARAPHVVLAKQRLGDRDVKIAVPDLSRWQGRTPVLVDDMISSGNTMLVAAAQLAKLGFARPICLTVHALFADDAYARLMAVSQAVVSTDTIRHDSNGIFVARLLATGISPPV
jgi:ribose-phosphate pyrophosphokinase